MAFDKAALSQIADEVDESGEDLTNPVNNTGRPIPAEGNTRVRFIEYIELGMLTTSFTQPGGKKKTTTAPRVSFGFELSGKNHPPMEFDGVTVPHVLRIKSSKGLNAKSGYIKLFKALTGDFSEAKNYVALLGDAFTGKVQHREFDKKDGTKGKAAHFGNATDGFTLEPATYVDKMDDTIKTVPVDEAIEPIRLFLWDRPTLDMWDSLYIEGEWDNGDVKNEWQERIKRAENFKGSPIYELLIEAGRGDEVELQQFDSKKEPVADPLGEAAPDPAEAAAEKAAAEGAAKAAGKAVAAAKDAAKGKVAGAAKKPATAPKKEPVQEPDPVVSEAGAGGGAAGGEEDDDAADFAAWKAAQAAKKAAAEAAAAGNKGAKVSKNKAADPLEGM